MTTATFKELDAVQLKTDIPDQGLAAGALGTVLMAFTGGTYLVEFANGNGETIAELELQAGDLALFPRSKAAA